ncbi:MAG: hypothetical protein IT307_13350, partial [Chloroflexi bacterium]|nr:hypothetical protein [Chloroflexota bacterium]
SQADVYDVTLTDAPANPRAGAALILDDRPETCRLGLAAVRARTTALPSGRTSEFAYPPMVPMPAGIGTPVWAAARRRVAALQELAR